MAAEGGAAREAIVFVTDRAVLEALEQAGLDFASLVDGADVRGAANDRLAARAPWRSIADVLASDVARVQAADRHAGVGVAEHAHRLFDVRWLSSPAHRFELVGVVNRLDRRPFSDGACGETRLVYRLAYATSRLPMTVIFELRADDSCDRAAARWLAPAGLAPAERGRWLASEHGPLAPALRSRERLVQLATNLQSVRWPSAVRPALGGHAEYALRAFSWAGTRYEPRLLEGTPDVARLLADRKLREELRAWIRSDEALVRIDEGTAILPERFLARDAALSVTPRGLARRANRPFRQLFAPRDFADLSLAGRRTIQSPEALLRRLDAASCGGCHQSRSVAGFHLLGEDGGEVAPGNALALAVSPHLAADLPRRAAYLRALAEGGSVDEARPSAERAALAPGGYGEACGLGDPGFAAWDCASGLRCDPYGAAAGESTVGTCLPERASVGDPCEPARIVAERDSHRDAPERASARDCGGATCERTRVGFPGGMCASSCAALPAEGTCGAIAILEPFNQCLARGEPFARCLAGNVRPGGLRACSERAPCRDDYICARSGGGAGSCIPPYFLFQLRVDGHP